MPSSVKQIYAIAAGVSLLALLGFVFAPHIFAAWVDAPNNPPTYGATGCSPAPCLEDDFKPITQTAAPQSKIGWLAVGSPTQNAPLYALDATGQVNASGGLCIAGSCQLSWASVVAAGLPVGTSGQTLRYDGTNWLANSNLYNDGTNVGIGTANPKTDPFGAKSLDVNGSAFASVFYDRDNTTYNLDPAGTSVLSSLSMKGTLNIQGGTAGNVLTSDAAGNATWGSPGANYWTLSGNDIYSNNAGNVGIGTTNPTGMLQIGTLSSGVNGSINGAGNPTRLIVNGANGSEAALTLGHYSAGYGLNLWVPANPSAPWPTYIDNINAYSGFRFRNNTSATPVELMTIDATGNVGIGTATPGKLLEVHTGTTPTTGFNGLIRYGDNFETWNLGINYNNGSSQHFAIADGAGNERLTIVSNISSVNAGNVGIGTATPASTLSVGGAGVAGAGIYGTGGTYGVYGTGGTYAGYFAGNVKITGQEQITDISNHLAHANNTGAWPWTSNVLSANYPSTYATGVYSVGWNTLTLTKDILGIQLRGNSDDGGFCDVVIPNYFAGAIVYNSYLNQLGVDMTLSGSLWNNGATTMTTGTWLFADTPSGAVNLNSSYNNIPESNKAVGLSYIPAGQTLYLLGEFNNGQGPGYVNCYVDVLYSN